MTPFSGWPADAPALLADVAADNSRDWFAAHRHRYDSAVLAPTRALAAALAPEFGPVRVFRPYVNRRFRPDAPPYRTDTGAVARSPGGTTRSVVLTATTLAVTAGHWRFDPAQLRRFRLAVDVELEFLIGELGLALDEGRALARVPRILRPDHPQADLVRRLGLQVSRAWPVGPWLATAEPLHRVRTAWRAAEPLVRWLDEHVGPPAPSRGDHGQKVVGGDRLATLRP